MEIVDDAVARVRGACAYVEPGRCKPAWSAQAELIELDHIGSNPEIDDEVDVGLCTELRVEDEAVIPRAADKRVVVAAAVESIVAGGSNQPIVTVTAEEPVGPIAAHEPVIAVLAVNEA